MATFYEIVHQSLKGYYKYILAIALLIVFYFVGSYAYNRFVTKAEKKKQFNNVANANAEGKELPIMFFFAEWCPHCKTAKPEWESFRNAYNDKQINGYNIKCIDVNCTEEDSTVTKMINEHGIDSFPTIKMIKDSDAIEFDSRITSDNLEEFVKQML